MTPSEQVIPKGVRVLRDRDGHVVLDLPTTQDPFLKVFLVLFGMPFAAIGASLVFGKGEWVGLMPLAIGGAVIWGGLYFMLGRVELRLGADTLAYTRLFFRRWKTREVAKGEIVGVDTSVAVRTNGRPSSWSVTMKVKAGSALGLPGSFKEPTVTWLRGLLARWAEVEG
jgi:hypothetical protein